MFFFFPIVCMSQTFSYKIDSEFLYKLNTTSAEIRYYLNQKKYNCALDELRKCDSSIVAVMQQLTVADVYLYNKDTPSFRKHFINHISNFMDYDPLEKLLAPNQIYFFMNSSRRELMDIVSRKREPLKHLENYILVMNKLRDLMAVDQFIRNYSNDTSIFRNTVTPFSKVDSINIKILLRLLQSDTVCICKSSELLTSIFIHLTRYDNITFERIIEYIERCYPLSYQPYLIAMLTDNREYSALNKHQKYYTYLFRSQQQNIQSIEDVDEDRRKMGLEALYYSFVSYGLPVPKYYLNKIKHECLE